MTPTPEVQARLRQYLLGQLTDNAREEVEKDLLASAEVFEELLVVEDELVDQYLNETLDAADRRAFENHFLATPERRDKLKFGRAFTRYLSTHASVDVAPKPASSPSQWAWTQTLFASPLRIGVFAIIVVGIVFGVWRIFIHRSEVDSGLLALNAAYREQRPVESRISQFTYAPFITTRGSGNDKVDQNELRRAELTLLEELNKNPTPAVRHALGKVFLAKKEFPRAIEQFNEALKSDPKNAQLNSDLGAARLEQGELAIQGQDFGRGFGLLSESLADISRALESDPNLLEALFNKALCLEKLKLREKAKAAWQDYLNHDSRSKWGDEARRYLQANTAEESSSNTAPMLLADFLAAFRQQDEDSAWRILSQNREFITGKMIPPQLSRAYISALLHNQAEKAHTFGSALIYAGELDLKKGGDRYTQDLAHYYLSATPTQHQQLAQALEDLDQGYRSCLDTDYHKALARFENAESQFTKAADIWEANLARYWTGYTYTQLDRIPESLVALQRVAEYSRDRNYLWLLAQTDGWIATNYSSLSRHSDAIRYHELSLNFATNISDTYQMQKSLTALGAEYASLQQERLSLGYHYRSLSLASESNGSPRQAWRSLLSATSALFTFKHYEAALAFGSRTLELGETEFRDPSLSYMLHLQLGQIYGRLHRFDEANKQAEEGLRVSESVVDQEARQKSTAASFLKHAQILRESGNNERALSFYANAINLYDAMSFNVYRYVAYKGRLLSALALNDDNAVDQSLPELLKMFQQYRNQIREEQYRNSFFDSEQEVYDIAIERAYWKHDLPAAVQYAEQSHGRALLDALSKTTSVEKTPAGNDRVSSRVAEPLDPEIIRRQLPEKLTILMFTVLPRRLLIWTISRSRFSVVEQPVEAEVLKSRVLNYFQVLNQNSLPPESVQAMAGKLYANLLSPVISTLPQDNRVCIIPDKFLSYLPFGALVSPDTGKYLIQERSIFYAPSINVLWDCTLEANKRARMDSGSIVAIGNPSYDQKTYPSLLPLASAEREARSVAGNFRFPTRLIGPDANKDDVLQAMQSSEIIHFAGHYVADESNPLQSRMLLAASTAGPVENSILTASEIALHTFDNTKLIVLSACQTSLEGYYDGEGSIGLARSFLEARIPVVVASQWAVDSDTTADLMISFYDYRKTGLSTVEALQAAQVRMLNSPTEAYRQPHYWAAFECIGGSGDY